MGTLITLFSPPLELKLLRPEACRQGREEGSSSVKGVKIDPPRGAGSGLAGVTAQLVQSTGMAAAACCAPLPCPQELCHGPACGLEKR